MPCYSSLNHTCSTTILQEHAVCKGTVAWEMVLANYRATISGALAKITGESFGPDYAKWKEWYEKNKEK